MECPSISRYIKGCVNVGIVGLVVAVPAIAPQVDQHIHLELLPKGDCQAQRHVPPLRDRRR